MRGRLWLGWLLALAWVPIVVLAEQPYVNIEQRLTAEQRQETGLDTLSPAQLERLNQLLREESAKSARTEPPRRADEPGRSSFIGLDDRPIHSRLKGSVSAWEPGTVFELDNGQQWKVLKGNATLRATLQAPEVVVVPGVAGRWFLQVHEDYPKARVYRID